MERQQLLKTSDRGVIFNGDVTSSRMAPLREDRVSSSSSPSTTYAKRLNQYETEARSGFLSAFSDFFAKNNSRSKSSFVCDVVVASVCLVFFSCCFFNIGAEASPVFSEKHFSTYHLIPSARNIRHLPCISRRTKEEGTCMFAIDCLKANGTHLGTCIDRFYFGSCCQVPEYVNPIDDNRIDDNSLVGKPLKKPIELDKTTVTQKAPVTPPTKVYVKSNVTSTTRVPTNHYITKKPITTQNDITKKPVDKNSTKVSDKVPEIIPSLKPSRHNASSSRPSLTTTTSTTTFKPSNVPTRLTTTQRAPTQSSIQTTIFINNNLYNATKTTQTSTRKPETTTNVPFKISTFQTVQENAGPSKATTRKPTTSNFVTRKPSPPQNFDTSIPFGTRLPSTTVSPTSPNKPVSEVQTNPTKKPLQTTTTTSTTYLTTHHQKPVRPTVTQKPIPERPTRLNTTTTVRPAIKRPQNSTLSNRRTTTLKPTTAIVKKPLTPTTTNSTVSVSTQKPTTLVYRPFTGSSSSQKPFSSSKPTVETSQTTLNTTNVTKKPILSVERTTIPPVRITTEKPTSVKRPVNNGTIIESTTKKTETKPIKKPISTTPQPEYTTVKKNITTAQSKPSSTVDVKTTTLKTPPVKKPLTTTVKPQATTAASSSTITTKQPQTTISPLTNEIDSPPTKKPSTSPEKPLLTSTEKVGLVTWSNILGGSSVTQSSILNVTNSEGWSPATPPPNWVLLQTVSPEATENITGPTVQPSNTIQPSKKPVSTTNKPGNISSTISTVVNNVENATNSPIEEEFSTFMYVSGEPTSTQSSIKNVSTSAESNSTTTSMTNLNTGNSTADKTESSENGTSTESMDEAVSTEKSTVSPIEGMTSSGPPLVSSSAVNMSDYSDVCGRRLWPEGRIVGGARSTFGRWPWQISLRQWRTSTYLHKCGAALLNENWAITAAHCVDSVPPSDLLLRLGEHDLASEEEPYGFQERRVQIVASHPQFDPRTFEYDLALLRFYEPVTFQPNILPVCVPTDDEGFIGKTAYVTGWGRLYEDGPLPSVLQEVSVPVIENAACESMYRNAGYIEHIPHIFICAGWRNGGFDSCEGDSGGPMVLQRPDKRFLLAGVISWGIGCAEPNQPGVYTRISQFRHWINQILQF